MSASAIRACFLMERGWPIVSLRESVTGSTHARILQKYAIPTLKRMFPRDDGLFQEDNATPHKSKIDTFTNELGGVFSLGQPRVPD